MKVTPTGILLVTCLAIIYGASAFHLAGILPLWVASLCNSIALYAIYTVSHEAVHGLAATSRLVNDAMGRAACAHEGISFAMLRILHLRHHNHTNHPSKDPDHVIGRKPRWALPIWVVVRLLHDNSHMIKHGLWRGKNSAWREHIATVLVQVIVATTFGSVCGFDKLLGLWIGPAILSGMAVELSVAWLVHYPHESQHHLEHSRIIESRLLTVVMFGQNLHGVHHMFPKIPWYRYTSMTQRALSRMENHRYQRPMT